jgi:alcohol dehydrogenase (cytochrome c)
MKNVSPVLAILFATCAPICAQTSVTGTWQAQTSPPGRTWTAVLRAYGGRVSGAVSSCASVGASEIYEGTIDGNTATFKCTSGDGDRTLTFTGTINSDEIDFTWNLGVRAGGNARHFDAMFTGSAPPRFTATRIPDPAFPNDARFQEMADRVRAAGPVTFDRILHADHEPQNWLTYSGTTLGQRYSRLTQITPTNVKNLELAWIWQTQSPQKFEATALVVGGVLYTVQAPNDVVALSAVTGRLLWMYPYQPAAESRVCCGRVNRGLAISGRTLFMGTLDAHLLAIDADTGKLLWNTIVANVADPACKGGACYAITHAPLVVKNTVIVGTAGSDNGVGGIRGVIAAFDVTTGKEIWRFFTVPGPGEPGNETWSGDSWKTGGAGVWNTGSYDPDLNLTYWGTGNPNPNYSPELRLGDNLYSDCVVALDADTGKLKWHYQFTPHDNMDWDAGHVPVLADIEWRSQPRRVMLFANKNGLMYVLDRVTGEFLIGKPFVAVNWMSGFNDKGRPVRTPAKVGPDGAPVMPRAGTSWSPPSYSPSTALFYIPSWERGNNPNGSPLLGTSYGAVRAFDPATGAKKWEFKRDDTEFHGVLTTASDLLFAGVWGDFYSGPVAARMADGYFYALDARTGELLWQIGLPGSVQSGPMTYSVAGKQYITVAAGNSLFAFALRQ